VKKEKLIKKTLKLYASQFHFTNQTFIYIM